MRKRVKEILRPLLYTDIDDPEAYVLFSNSDKPGVQHLRKGFQHVSVLIKDGYDFVLIDPAGHGIEVKVGRVDTRDIHDLAGKEDVTVVPTRIIKHTTRYKVPTLFSCVETAKRLLGVRSWFIMTPYQLYTHLTK